ncbi:hypothetical protein P3339_11975 [Microbulbifer sp. MLAF003]|uniref:hypothetical protein n=1 Tax=unclassified Microbulbifer TaxID=2619833 RepID=UPI0024AE3638|nr:hypothetical protein [Microbulbifer sp. MLAF003]WHI49208.1 hypothetical protein P3339_11975 [Microbulbifer sp. MLAF003]
MPSQKEIQEQINQLSYPLDKILNTANNLLKTGTTGASTSEQIAAAFVLERMEYLPQGWSVIEAWERLDTEWQYYVKLLQQECRHLIEAIEEAAPPF